MGDTMKDSSRTKQSLIEELISLRRRTQELEQAEADRRKAEEALPDIADRKRMEEELRKSAEKYRNILENIEEGYYETDLAGNFTFFTSSLCRLLGYSKEEMAGLNYRAYMDAENAKKVFRAFHEVYVTGIPAKFESEMIRKDGARVYNEDSVSLIAEPGRKPTGFRGIVRNVTERKKMEEALENERNLLKSLIDNLPDRIYAKDSEGRFIICNEAMIRRMGKNRMTELVGKSDFDLLSPELAQRFHDDEQEILRTGIPLINREEPLETEDGKITRWNLATKMPLLDKQGNRIGIVGMGREITDRKRMVEELRDSEERYRRIFEASSDAILLRRKNMIIFANPAAIKLFRADRPEDLIGKRYLDLVHPDDRALSVERIKKTLNEGLIGPPREHRLLALDGQVLQVESTGVPVQYRGEIHVFGIFRDISERKRIEEELRRNQERAERLAREMAVIAEIGKVVSSTLVLEEVYQRFAAESNTLIPHDRLVVNLNNPRENERRCIYVSGIDISECRPGTSKSLSGSTDEMILRTRSGVIMQAASVAEMAVRFPTVGSISHAKTGLCSLLSVPLPYRDEVIGTLRFWSKKPEAYGEMDLILAERIGAQISGAIANAQLYADLKKAQRELKESERKYQELSIVDDLTQLYNSRQFFFQLRMELDRSNRYRQPLSLLLLDLDDFKTFNDSYGHVEGDKVLRRLGQAAKRCLRKTDSAYRYGGEEFTFLLPMTTVAHGAVIAERIRTEFKKETFCPAPGQDIHMTVSIGLAQYKAEEEMMAFVHRTDQLMYRAKENGKDGICCEPWP